MNDDELKRLWRGQSLRAPAFPPAQVMSAMKRKATQLRRTLFVRDALELSACVFIGVIFGIYFFTYHAPLVRLGALITVTASVFIALKLLHARHTTPAAKSDATIVESLRAELRSVRTQAQLLRSVAWWYLLPLSVGTLVFVWGMPFGNLLFALAFKIGFTLGSLGLDVLIYRFNQRAVSKQLLPVETQLQSLLHSAETGQALDETQVAHLRPIALSLAAASQVRPVEFKVAFWQLALWGEIGVMGIWFFLMLSLALGGRGGKATEPARDTLAPSFQFEATNRYSIVAQQVVDLLNSRDYAAVHRLYNPEMGRKFPPKETSEFYARLASAGGNIESIEGPTGNGYHGWTTFRLHFQRSELTMSLVLDADDKIAGIYFRTVPKPRVKIGELVLRIFSWPHLAWCVPFFLVGLFYSWLLQKLTKRAVGISLLGIHLSKGQSLILWDEIKEVRPLRVLNIRSLWLIKESGEESLMRWTSLERRSELKAAVDQFAPPNHPIRKYLSLLR